LNIQYHYDEEQLVAYGNLTSVTRSSLVAPETRTEKYTYTEGEGIEGHNLTSYTDPTI